MNIVIRICRVPSKLSCSRLQGGSRAFLTSAPKQKTKTYEGDGKTYINILNKETDLGLMVDSYSQVGFRLNNGVSTLGPIALFPHTVLSWNVNDVRDVHLNSLELFFRLEPKLDLLVLGIGDANARLDPKIMLECKRRGLNLEVLATEQACTTFNFLNAEARCVAAALIPPDTFRVGEDDMVKSNIHFNKLIDKDYA